MPDKLVAMRGLLNWRKYWDKSGITLALKLERAASRCKRQKKTKFRAFGPEIGMPGDYGKSDSQKSVKIGVNDLSM